MNVFFSSLPYQLLPWQWLAWICLGLCIGLSKAGYTGVPSIIIPVIAIIFGARESTGLTLPLLCFADVLAVIYYNRHTEWKYLIKLIPWTLAGFALALWVDSLVPVQAFKYLMGGCILAGLIVMVWNERRSKDAALPSAWWYSALFGIAGGFSTTIGNIAGPIMSVFLLSMRLPKNSFVGTSAWFFLIVNYLKLPVQIFLWKNITWDVLAFDLTLVPFVLIGGVIGVITIKKISEPVYRKVIMVLTLVSTIFMFI
jgi:uncharacterized membrane protein YfcA